MPPIKPTRRKPAPWLGYPEGTVPRTRAAGFTYITVHCVGGLDGVKRCHHQSRLMLTDLPDWSWGQVGPYLRCTDCGSVGFVDIRVNWGEVIDFNTPTGRMVKGIPKT